MGKIMTKTISYSWPGLDNYVNDKKKGFLFSFEVKVSTLIGFILIMMQFFAGQLKLIPKSKVFSAVSGRPCTGPSMLAIYDRNPYYQIGVFRRQLSLSQNRII